MARVYHFELERNDFAFFWQGQIDLPEKPLVGDMLTIDMRYLEDVGRLMVEDFDNIKNLIDKTSINRYIITRREFEAYSNKVTYIIAPLPY